MKNISKALGIALAALALLVSASASAQTMQVISAPAADSTIRPGALYESGDLTIGSSGQGVTELQGMLSKLGFLQMPVTATPGYFGPITANALARFQAALGVPSTGFFGPMTRNAFALYYWNNPTFNQTYPTAQYTISTTTSTGTNPITGLFNMNGVDGTVYNGSWRYDAAANQWLNTTNNTSSGPSIMGGSGYWYNGSWYNTDPNIQTNLDASSSTSSNSSGSSVNTNTSTDSTTNSGTSSVNTSSSSSSNSSLDESVLNTSN